MSRRRGPLAEISWFQVAASVLASVTAAWIASSLGVAGTLIGAAMGSFVITISTAFYGRTLDKGRTLLVTTAAGTVVQQRVEDGDIAEAIQDVEESGSPAVGAKVVDDKPGRLRWKPIVITTVSVLALSVAAIGAYELVTDTPFGSDPGNPRIGNPFGGHQSTPTPSDTPATTENPTADPSATPTTAAPSPAPTATTPPPTVQTPEPTATPTSPTPGATGAP
ncbi:hypothetical protein [Aeromicrobium sp.]|uniref:hypothetical protein n=1 Tax=Aeromicrobium sp. TaxID=1871063 RepID=UPI0019C1CA0D|nr:hypothetical protein [Aeromicrobium sp.]MBC7632705.1 hypothetical protein [Aeromicrobium sp.]